VAEVSEIDDIAFGEFIASFKRWIDRAIPLAESTRITDVELSLCLSE